MTTGVRSTPMEILLVEDGLTDARMTIFAIRRSGVHHRLTLVRNLEDARLFLSQSGIFAQAPKVDLLLLDLMLPDGSGLDLLRWLKTPESDPAADPGNLTTHSEPQPEEIDITQELESHVPTTVVLTASPNDETKAACQSLGAADFLAKPVQQEAFMRLVREHKRLMVHTTATEDDNLESTSLLTITP